MRNFTPRYLQAARGRLGPRRLLSLLLGHAWLVALGCGQADTPVREAAEPAAADRALDSDREMPSRGDLGVISVRLIRSTVPRSPEVFEVQGLAAETVAALERESLSPEQWTELFEVSVAADPPAPPMLGAYHLSETAISFRPRFALEPGLTYRARFDPARLPGASGGQLQPIIAEFAIPKAPAGTAASVSRVYPTTSLLPENQLKFYIHFTAPMSIGVAYEHVHLIKASGGEVELPFLELDQELWTSDGRRFTLFFDPGRIKRGLLPREEVGPALIEGEAYTLLIDREWPDARGEPLLEEHRKTFQVGPPDDTTPDVNSWRLLPPAAGTRDPLTVHFPEPMEHALLGRMLWIVGPDGSTLSGRIEIGDSERRWRFTPGKAWAQGAYRLTVQTTLEDLAGNSIGQPFEVDVFERVERRIDTDTVALAFETKPSP